MRILNWTERVDGWHAGPFHIEYLGRKLWVLSVRRNGRAGSPQRIISNGTSRGAMMSEAGRLAARKVRSRRVYRNSILFALSVALAAFGALSAARLAPLATVVGSTAGFVSAVSILSAFAGRAFDHLSSHYQ